MLALTTPFLTLDGASCSRQHEPQVAAAVLDDRLRDPIIPLAMFPTITSRGDADLQVLWISATTTPDLGRWAWRLANLGYCRSPCHATAPGQRSATQPGQGKLL